MAIKVKCDGCGAKFSAKDELAGRKVKCPKCKKPLKIPSAPKPAPQKAAVASGHNPLLDLLDEQDIKSVARGPVCLNCAAELTAGAIICMECGYNHETGERLETEAYEDDLDGGSDLAMSDADRIMAKAEKDIDDMPVTSDSQDFGDGAESFLIAGVAFVIGAILIGVGITVIFMMDIVGLYLNSGFISFCASMGLYVCMGLWITIVAFRQKAPHGVACVCTAFLWCIVYGFMQGKTLLLPTIVLIAGLVIGLASGTYVSFQGIAPKPESRIFNQDIEEHQIQLASGFNRFNQYGVASHKIASVKVASTPLIS